VKEEDVHLVEGGGGAEAAGSSGFGGGGNTFWLKRSSAFAGVSPRYTISIFNLRSAVRRDSASGIPTYYNSIRFRTALLNVLGWKGMSIFVASASMIYFVDVYWFIRKYIKTPTIITNIRALNHHDPCRF
jgi:hypothetical protein